jgi:signal transduction histidine kinase
MRPSKPVRLPLPFIRWRGFTLQLFLFTILPLTLLLIVVIFGSIELHHAAMRDLVGDRDLRAVRAAAASLESAFAHRTSFIQLAAGDALQGDSLSELFSGHRELPVVLEGGLARYNAGGQLTDQAGPDGAWKTGLQSADLEAIASGQWILFPAGDNEDVPGAWMLTGSRASNGDLVVGAFSVQDVIQETVDQSFDTRHTTVMVVGGNPELQILYFTGPSFFHDPLLSHPGMDEVIRGESGIRYDSSNHQEQLIAYAPIASIGWGLVISEAWEDISSPLLRTTQFAPLILVPVLLLAILALWFGARSIVLPLQSLEGQAYDLSKGNFNAIRQPVGGIIEIRNLQEQLIDMAEQLEAAQQSLRSYIGAITAGIENERRSLARELHDDTIQNLIALNQRVQMAAMSPLEEQEAAVEELGPMVQDAISNLRRTVRGLRPIYLEDLGLVTALEMLARETEQVSGQTVQFEVHGPERRLEGEIEMMIYRMVQESLNNVVRHANASQVWLELDFKPGSLQVKVRDDGRGFHLPANRSEFPSSGHFGLLGMHERAELINAHLEISSSPGGGTVITIEIATDHKVG